MTLLISIVAGIPIALLRGGSLRRLAALSFRLGWLVFLCLAVQFWVTNQPADGTDAEQLLQAVLMLASYAGLVAVVWANRRTVGMRIIALGLLLNLAVMAANGGFMPVSPEAVVAARLHTAESLPAEGGRLPRSKDILLSAQHTRLWILSDVIVIPAAPGVRIYSIGDLVVGLGAFVLLQAAMVPRREEGVLNKNGMSAS